MESQSTDPVVTNSEPASSAAELPAAELPAATLPAAESPAAELSAARLHQTRIRRARRNRIDDYQYQSLSRLSPLKACLGSVNSDLMRIANSMGDMIQEALQSSPPTIENVKKLTPAADVLLRVSRQVERFAELELGSDQSEEDDFDPMTGDMAMDPEGFMSEEM